ncbi:MAG: recombinase family protein [Pseudonocardiales bacterium]
MSETRPTRRPRRNGAGQSVGGSRREWAGQPAAIYCRMSHVKDEDQTGVDRQERICRQVAERLGVVIAGDAVFVDNNRSAWQRQRHRPGWDALLEAIRAGRVAHVLVYHPDRLMRQPRDLEELLSICDNQQVTLHGEANQRDLSDPDDRFFLRIEVAHACRSSDDTSRRLRAALADRARDGVPHSGPRPFGYTADRMHLVENEAEIVRELFRRVVQGESVTGLARELNQRGIRTTMGNTWAVARVRELLRSPRVAGMQVYHGELMGAGTWPAIVPQGLWEEAQERLKFRATQLPPRTGGYYLLRGVVFCARCGTRMVGAAQSGRRSYVCSRTSRVDDLKCTRKFQAAALESFVTEAAIRLLETLDVSGAPSTATLTSPADDEAVSKDLEELAELREMWDAREMTTKEYREMRRTVEARIKKARARTVIRPAVEVLDGMVGPDAAPAWKARYDAGDFDRLNAILRFLFAAVRIGESTARPFRLDFDRVSIERNELHA